MNKAFSYLLVQGSYMSYISARISLKSLMFWTVSYLGFLHTEQTLVVCLVRIGASSVSFLQVLQYDLKVNCFISLSSSDIVVSVSIVDQSFSCDFTLYR